MENIYMTKMQKKMGTYENYELGEVTFTSCEKMQRKMIIKNRKLP